AAVTASEAAVLELIRPAEIAELALELIRIPGVNPPGGEGDRARALATACEARGLHVRLSEVTEDRPNLSAVLPGGPGTGLLFLGHTDVVPLGDGWDPALRAGTIRDERLYGRGSADTLGGLAAAVVAMAAIGGAGVSLRGPIELAAVVDEEENGLGIRHLLASRRGAARWAGCIVAEPTDLQTVVAARGDMYLELSITGRAAHSGSPSDGVNAIAAAATAVAEIERMHHESAAAPHPLVGPVTYSVGTIHGGSGTSIVAAQCCVMIDRRVLPEEQPAAVVAAVRTRLAESGLNERDVSWQLRSTMEMPGFETAPSTLLVQVTDAALAAAGGPQRGLGGWSAACDGGFVARDARVPTVVLGPGSITTQAHRPNESVGIAELGIAARAYALAALRLLPGGRP
ncbi:MAG: M20/M25/M40 family metallo-hydrolase, partial [Microlunatus sp.]|nr:M20/M25/M40 family metallo-hydrolase [Microlunatus sp.]